MKARVFSAVAVWLIAHAAAFAEDVPQLSDVYPTQVLGNIAKLVVQPAGRVSFWIAVRGVATQDNDKHWHVRWKFDPITDQRRLAKMQTIIEAQLLPNADRWFSLGEKDDVPRDCPRPCVSRWGDQYIWVPAHSRDQFIEVTLSILRCMTEELGPEVGSESDE